MKHRLLAWILAGVCAGSLSLWWPARVSQPEALAKLDESNKPFAYASGSVDYNRDVLPILAGKCFTCHGPDKSTRKGGLRLDLRDVATKPAKSGDTPIVPGNAKESEAIRRIHAGEEDGRMPPRKGGKPLTPSEKGVLERWIDQGAEYKQHWSFVAVERPALPAVKDKTWGANEIDAFVLHRLEEAGLKPSPRAHRVTLIRRLSFDLRGSPPSLQEVDAFLADRSADAYVQVVDRMLASPHYGEKMAVLWLDLARFGDTSGYHMDSTRQMSLWRDWVINAFNKNMPFDQFTVEQLAGDLLPGATTEQKIASGFNRNTRFNEEGGVDPEEYVIRYNIDRTNTLGQVWLGLTLGCAECHSHKYDPISHKEYYQLFAYFTGIKEPMTSGPGVHGKPLPPLLKVPTPEQAKELAEHRRLLPIIDKAIAKELARFTNKEEARDFVGPLERDREERLKKIKEIDANTPYSLISEEMAKPRPAHVLIRGDFQQKGERVERGVPAAFPPLPKNAPNNRLGLARWLVRPDHPLTPRVAVNRLWAQMFGNGIVHTIGDLGTQGDFPSHPALLDWLASEFVEHGWDVKKMLRTIALSSAYQQSSAFTSESIKLDPHNRLLARMPRYRLSAEELRDSALSIAGLLNPKVGGPSFMPYQPPDFYKNKNEEWPWMASPGDEQYRRGLYAFWRRTALHPMFAILDAPNREECTAVRARTNTPLQALVTLNDPTFVEAARVFAQKIITQGPKELDGRLTFAFRGATCRLPSEQELAVLRHHFQLQQKRFDGDKNAASKLVNAGQYPRDASLNEAELAAWTALANMLLNLDEVLSRE